MCLHLFEEKSQSDKWSSTDRNEGRKKKKIKGCTHTKRFSENKKDKGLYSHKECSLLSGDEVC